MASVTYPVVLNETGQLTNQKIAALGPKIDADRVSTAERLIELGTKIDNDKTAITQQLATLAPKIESNGETIAQQLAQLSRTTDTKLAELVAKIPSIVTAMDQLDIIYYVES